MVDRFQNRFSTTHPVGALLLNDAVRLSICPFASTAQAQTVAYRNFKSGGNIHHHLFNNSIFKVTRNRWIIEPAAQLLTRNLQQRS